MTFFFLQYELDNYYIPLVLQPFFVNVNYAVKLVQKQTRNIKQCNAINRKK